MKVVREPQSAGGVVLRRDQSGALSALLVRQRGEWRLPKGMMEPGETLPATAFREVLEESGVHAAIVEPICQASWTYEYGGVECVETCTFFLMLDIGLPYGDHDEETEFTSWMPLPMAADALTYLAEQDTVRLVEASPEMMEPDDVVIAGESTGDLAARGRLATNRESARSLLAAGERVVLALPSFAPRDAALIGECAAVTSLREGPSSHAAVVAAALGVPCLTRLRAQLVDAGLHAPQGALLPAGSPVEVDEQFGVLRLLTPEEWTASPSAGNPSPGVATPRAAFEWAMALAGDIGIPQPRNWKLFKRDLLSRYFPTPATKRFPSPWDAQQVAAEAISLAPAGTVRCSAFPRDIACHAVSIPLDASREDSVAARIAELDPTADLEVFVQQNPSDLAWRLVWNHGRFTMEAGIGQAMYLFEEERGAHPLGSATWDTGQGFVAPAGDEMSAAHLNSFLERHRSDLVGRSHRIAHELRIDVFAVEGYFHLVGETYVGVDMDLPFDWVFMSDPNGPS
ncbi:NUDIX hydrolase [Ornithinimicrobium sp. W1679]|uniref:NUDIX hydrolase n=1 Tax=Ornithinimicrobium sp. W1679 TaxID=3418770 RepID=UPI003CE77F15